MPNTDFWKAARLKPSIALALLGLLMLTPLAIWGSQQAATSTEGPMRSPCDTHPAARGYADMVYDWTTGIAYLFGGIDHPTPSLDYPLFDVWSHNSSTQRWKLLFDSSSAYNAFQRDAAALDPSSKKVVLFSTFVNCENGCGVETWIYDIAANTFVNVSPGAQPTLRWGARMAYDAESRRAILFGGSDGNTGETLNDTWVYDFTSNTWTEMKPATSPPPHHFTAMAYHPFADRVILFGGYDIWKDESLNDTWAYDYNSNSWTNLLPSTPPPARLYHSLAWDIWSNKLILFGGVSRPYEPILGDTWAFDLGSNAWTMLDPKKSPSPRAWQVMEGTWSGPLLFGGSPQHDDYTYDDTWRYNSLARKWMEAPGCTTEGAK